MSVFDIAFCIAAVVAGVCTLMVVIGRNPVHALLYLIVSLLAVAVIFFLFGAPFAALLEVIVYAGAIMVLFVFVVMMLNLGDVSEQEAKLLTPRIWIGPSLMAALLLAEVLWLLIQGGGALEPAAAAFGSEVTVKQVGIALYGPYLLAVELASMLLLGALVAAFHVARADQ
ncbi:MAG: NADH-quinone oxidoreductase subunit J [Gammaproteobacteria bacterium]